MDFNVNVHVRTTGKEQIDVLEKQINALKSEKIKIGVDVDSGNLNHNSSKAKNISRQLQRTFDNSIKNVKFDSNTFYKEYFDKAKKVIDEAKKINKSFEKEISEVDTSGIDKNALKAVKARVSAEVKAEQEYIKEQKRLSKIRESESDLYYNPKRDAYQSIGKKSDIQNQMSAYYKELEIQSAKQAEEYSKIIAKTRDKVLNGSYDAKSSSMFAKLGVYEGQDNNLINIARQQETIYNNTLSKLKDHFDSNNSFSLNDEEIVKSFTNMTLAAERFENVMTQVRNTQSKPLGIGVAERSANTVKKYYDENSKAVKKYGIELKDLENQYRQATTVADKADLDNKFKNIKATISAEGLSGKSFTEELGRGFKQIGQFAVTYGVLQRIPELLGNMAHEVLNVDTAMTELRKVSNASDNQLSDYFEHAYNSAKKYGSEIQDVISSAADWKRLGYTIEESSKLADSTTLLQRVGDNMTQESSASGLISTLKGFNKEADEALSIVDKVNQVANTQPIDTSGLFAGLERSASSMSAANNTLEQTISLITAANSVVQDPDSIGMYMCRCKR